MKDRKKQRDEVANSLVLVLQFGINVIVPILLCTMVGFFLARATGADWITIIAILVGIIAAFNSAYRSVKRYLKNEESPGQRARRMEEESRIKSEEEHD